MNVKKIVLSKTSLYCIYWKVVFTPKYQIRQVTKLTCFGYCWHLYNFVINAFVIHLSIIYEGGHNTEGRKYYYRLKMGPSYKMVQADEDPPLHSHEISLPRWAIELLFLSSFFRICLFRSRLNTQVKWMIREKQTLFPYPYSEYP